MAAGRRDILLVEDSPGDTRLIREMLADEIGREAFELRVAGSLADALGLISARRPHIVLLDLSLPDSFGLETLFRIGSAAHADTPVVVLTGNEDREVALGAVKAGAQDFLVKQDLNGRLLAKTIQYACERKQNEARLRTSESRFRSLAELSADWYWEQDASGILTYLSEGVLERSGIDPAALAARPWHEAPMAAPGTDWAALSAHFAGRRAFHDFVIAYRAPGRDAPRFSISGVPIIENGEFQGYRGLGKDVTARERAAEELRGSEERLRTIMDTGRDAIVMLDREERIAFANRQACDLLGCDGALLKGRRLGEFIRHDSGIAGAADEGRAVRVRRPGGTSADAVEVRFPLSGADGLPSGALAVLTDLTVYKEREMRVRELASLAAGKAEAERASSAKSKFMAAMSHDLRQPMHALGLFIEDLRGGDLDAHARVVVGHMQSALRSAQSLLDSILMFSRLESGTVAPDIVHFPLDSVLDRLRSSFRETARQGGLRFTVASTDAVIRSDPALVERICANLVSNALRYTRKGGVVVGCRDRGDHVLVEVWDTGFGIAPEHQEAIFREYFRIENGVGTGGGVGLGLAIVQSCARLLECPVAVRSVPGRGSRFSVRLPKAQAGEPQVLIPAEDGEETIPDALFEGLFVALVDDDDLILRGAGSLLRRWGCEVVQAPSGSEIEALVAGTGRVPDLLISDLRLDGEVGTDVVARMRARFRPGLPALLISGDTSLQTAREIRRHGLPMLYKPVGARRLRAAIAELVDR